MHVILRRERKEDYRAAECVIKAAYWNTQTEGGDENYVAHVLRRSSAFVPELTYVAENENGIIGSIMYSRAIVECDDGSIRDVLNISPIAVLPVLQRRGIGLRMLNLTARLAARAGHSAIILYGEPLFFGKAGFVPAEQYGIGTASDAYSACLLARELQPGALSGCAGRYFEDMVFYVGADEAAAYDREFDSISKRSGLPAQRRFSELVSMRRPRNAPPVSRPDETDT